MDSNSANLVEEYSFLIQDFKMEHASAEAVLNIRVHYKYAVGLSSTAYPDFKEIADAIKEYLTDYPNKDAYWEVINKGLALMVIGNYPALASVTSELEMQPSTVDPYFNSSKVTCQR